MRNDKLLIFDCDGTLVDSEGIANEIFLKGVNALGIPVTQDEAWEHFPGTSMALCIKYVEDTYEVKLPEGFVERQRAIQRTEFAKRLKPIRGIHETLLQLAQYPVKCVASNGPMDVIKANLNTTGLSPYFEERIFSAYTLNIWKPRPDLFLHAAETLGYDSVHSIVIEDSVAGMQAGINAGMTVLGYVPPEHPYEAKIEGVIEFTEMSQLPELIESLT